MPKKRTRGDLFEDLVFDIADAILYYLYIVLDIQEFL